MKKYYILIGSSFMIRTTKHARFANLLLIFKKTGQTSSKRTNTQECKVDRVLVLWKCMLFS